MATVVRLKRRRDEDPLEILLLAAKKQRNEKSDEAQSGLAPDKSIFKFAGTVSSKGDGISQHVREAIRKEKLEKEYRRHQSDIVGTVKQESRQHKHMKSQQNRLKVISKHRALDLEYLDKSSTLEGEICQKCGQRKNKFHSQSLSSNRTREIEKERIGADGSGVKAELQDIKTNGEDDNTSGRQEICYCDPDTLNTDNKTDKLKKENIVNDEKNASIGSGKDNTGSAGGLKASELKRDIGDGLFCLVDVEAESSRIRHNVERTSSDQITCNSEPMEREIVSERADDDYVYDIYYTNSQQFDFRMFERDLTFEAFSNSLLVDREIDDVDDEFVYEDDEDENAESNWRNDYPDEDPQFFENGNSNYNYGNELDDYVAFETETGNQLADWMSWRCNIDSAELSSEDEDLEHYGDAGTTYDGYYRHVRKEMGEDDGDESDDF